MGYLMIVVEDDGGVYRIDQLIDQERLDKMRDDLNPRTPPNVRLISLDSDEYDMYKDYPVGKMFKKYPVSPEMMWMIYSILLSKIQYYFNDEGEVREVEQSILAKTIGRFPCNQQWCIPALREDSDADSPYT